MARITDLQIQGFRCFTSLTTRKLSRVNLFVGANNSGKTAVLEAFEVVASRSPSRLWTSLERRGEFVRESGTTPSMGVQFDLRQLIAGRPESVRDGVLFSMSATLAGREPQPEKLSLQAMVRARHTERARELRITSESTRTGSSASGGLRLQSRFGFGDPEINEYMAAGFPDEPSVLFLAAGEVSPASIRKLWAEVVGNPDAHYVDKLAAMVDPRIKEFLVAPVEGARGWEGIFVRMKDEKTRVPIGGFGDGLRRALLFAVALARCRGGVLLIDEIDDGLHYSLLPKLWRFLVEGARELDVQIFTTTHSKDSLEAVDALHRTQPSVASDISIHRLEVGRSESIDLEASDVSVALASDQEVR